MKHENRHHVPHLCVLFISLAVFLGICCNGFKTTGTDDTTDTGITAMLSNPDGSPAQGASVRIFQIADTSRTPAVEVLTNEKGIFATHSLAKGTYNVYAEKGALVAFQDSIRVIDDTVLIDNDTLEEPTTLTAVVGVQSNHDPQTVTVQVLGTDLYSNVDKNGYFTINRMAKGDFTLRLATTLNDYTPTYVNVTLREDTPDTLPDTLWLIYTGIPIVQGISASYDSTSGVVQLCWPATEYRDLQDYLVYRDPFTAIAMSSQPIGITTAACYFDTIFTRTVNGDFSQQDTTDRHFKYRVKIRNNSQEIGQSYKYLEVTAASPAKLRSAISSRWYHIGRGTFTDSTSPDDSLQLISTISNTRRKLLSVRYSLPGTDTLLRERSIDSLQLLTDTITVVSGDAGLFQLMVTITDVSGLQSTYPVSLPVINDPPVANIAFSSSQTPIPPNTDNVAELNIPFSISGSESEDGFGTIVKWEWDLGNTGTFIESSTADTTWNITTLFSNDDQSTTGRVWTRRIILRVTDDDGMTALGEIKVSPFIRMDQTGGALPLNTDEKVYDLLQVKNRICIVTRQTIGDVYEYDKYRLFSSTDGKTVALESDSLPFAAESDKNNRFDIRIAAMNDTTLVAIQYNLPLSNQLLFYHGNSFASLQPVRTAFCSTDSTMPPQLITGNNRIYANYIKKNEESALETLESANGTDWATSSVQLVIYSRYGDTYSPVEFLPVGGIWLLLSNRAVGISNSDNLFPFISSSPSRNSGLRDYLFYYDVAIAIVASTNYLGTYMPTHQNMLVIPSGMGYWASCSDTFDASHLINFNNRLYSVGEAGIWSEFK